jgi:hypothetical protein
MGAQVVKWIVIGFVSLFVSIVLESWAKRETAEIICAKQTEATPFCKTLSERMK